MRRLVGFQIGSTFTNNIKANLASVTNPKPREDEHPAENGEPPVLPSVPAAALSETVSAGQRMMQLAPESIPVFNGVHLKSRVSPACAL